MPKINTITDFINAVHTALAAAFPECCVEITSVTKNNGVCENSITVQTKNQTVVPAFYMEPYFEEIHSGKTLEEVIRQIISSCAAALSYTETGINADDITDFEPIKDNICYKLVNKQLNSKLLVEVPYRDYHGLAIVYYFRYAAEKGILTASITNSLAQMWGIDEESLFTLASSNTPRLCRGIVLTLDNVLSSSKSLKTKPYAGFDFTCSETDILPMYVATNASKTYGAAVILYDGLLETAAKRLGSFYALPSSVHEFMFIPDTFGNVEDIKQMVQEINAAEVPEEEVLSDNIYHYDSNAHELKIVV